MVRERFINTVRSSRFPEHAVKFLFLFPHHNSFQDLSAACKDCVCVVFRVHYHGAVMQVKCGLISPVLSARPRDGNAVCRSSNAV